MSNISTRGNPTAVPVGANPYNTYGLATQGFVWAAISSVSGEYAGCIKSVNEVLPDENANVDVSMIQSVDGEGGIHEIYADLTVLSGGEEMKLQTNVDLDNLKTYVDERIDTLSGDTGAIAEASGGWNNTETVVEETSASWNNVRTKVETASADWDNATMSMETLSSGWENVRVEIESSSADWHNVETKVEETSGEWDNVYTSVNSTSGEWNNAYTSVSETSAEWDSVYSTVNEASGGWLNHVTTKEVPYGENETLTFYTSGISNPSNGDLLVLKKYIVEGDNTKFAYTAFSYDGSDWSPVAGNYSADGIYDAETVFFTKNLTSSYAIGNITLDNGIGIVESKGKNLKQVFDAIFLKEMFPTKTSPSITLNSTNFGTFESGTKKTPTYSITYNKGSYTYGPTSTAAATSYSATFMGTTYADASRTLPEVTLTDAMSSENGQYRVAAFARYDDDSATPVTNLGNPYPSVRITAGSTPTKYSTYLKSYRQAFHGSLASKDGTFDSDLVRTLSTSSGSYPTKGTTVLALTYPLNAVRAVFAYPAAIGDAVSINDANAFDADIIGAFTKITVDVDDVAGANPIPYNVYYKDAANPNDKTNTYTLHL